MSKQKELFTNMQDLVAIAGPHACQQALSLAIKEYQPRTPMADDPQPFKELVKHFQLASERIAYPKVWIDLPSIGDCKLQRNRNGKDPGSISITDHDKQWLGTVRSDGKLFIPREFEGLSGRIRQALLEFQANPKDVAKQYGHLTNHCCFCGRQLMETSSVHLGYGPICAETWGLPHGQNGDLDYVPSSEEILEAIS